jgi:hypothetical protein
MECESLTAVPSLSSVIQTSSASEHVEELFLERFEKEIVQKCSFTLSRPQASEDQGGETKRLALKHRILAGTNACTRVLTEEPKPLLIVLISTEKLALPWVHIPVLADRLQVPLLLLSASASNQLSRLLRARKVSVLTFLPRAEPVIVKQVSAPESEQDVADGGEAVGKNNDGLHKAVDSFVEFVLKKGGLGSLRDAKS